MLLLVVPTSTTIHIQTGKNPVREPMAQKPTENTPSRAGASERAPVAKTSRSRRGSRKKMEKGLRMANTRALVCLHRWIWVVVAASSRWRLQNHGSASQVAGLGEGGGAQEGPDVPLMPKLLHLVRGMAQKLWAPVSWLYPQWPETGDPTKMASLFRCSVRGTWGGFWRGMGAFAPPGDHGLTNGRPAVCEENLRAKSSFSRGSKKPKTSQSQKAEDGWGWRAAGIIPIRMTPWCR